MQLKLCFAVLACAALLCAAAQADDEPAPKRQWDQDEALSRVKKVIEIETSGKLPWDDIAWETDVDKAVARSEKENKPLFVYIFLKKNIGPENAPC